MKQSENIVHVKVVKATGKQNWGNTAERYRVEQVHRLKGTELLNSEIMFLNDTVTVGEEYIVMIQKGEEYDLLTSKNSVFTVEEAEQIPELSIYLK